MDVDESFAEYVAARWSMLYRLAVVLAGEAEADDLTQAALVRAYLIWSEVREAPSADDQVKRILATTAVRSDAPAEPDAEDRLAPDASDRDRLWAEVSALPRRQRAVLVLRHYESLSDAEIAGIVKQSASTVASVAGALETGIDRADLREELAHRAEQAVIPLPPIEALVEAGRRARCERRRRTATRTAVVAAVAVAGLVLTTVVQGWRSDGPHASRRAEKPVDAPTFLGGLPRGRPAEIAYSERQFLHLPGGRGILLDGTPAAVAETPHWVYVAYLSGKIVRVDIETAAIETVAEHSGGQLVTDAVGSQVAWLQSGRGRAVVHLEGTDPADFQGVSGSWEFPVRLRCCDDPFVVNGITRIGELVASLPAENRTFVRDTRASSGGVREISGVGNGVISQVTERGLVVHYPPLQYAVGQIEHDVFLQLAEVPALDADFADPLGHRVVYADDSGDIQVREQNPRGRSRRAGATVTLRLPKLDDGFAGLHWEDTEHVLLDVYDESMPDGALVRCDVRDGACELADDLGGPHLLPR